MNEQDRGFRDYGTGEQMRDKAEYTKEQKALIKEAGRIYNLRLKEEYHRGWDDGYRAALQTAWKNKDKK